MKSSWLTMLALQRIASTVQAENTCTATLNKEVNPSWPDKWSATAICTSLDPGCRFRATVDFAGAFDIHSDWSNQLNKKMTTEPEYKVYGYRDPVARVDIEC